MDWWFCKISIKFVHVDDEIRGSEHIENLPINFNYFHEISIGVIAFSVLLFNSFLDIGQEYLELSLTKLQIL